LRDVRSHAFGRHRHVSALIAGVEVDELVGAVHSQQGEIADIGLDISRLPVYVHL
jgi:hypothetical protein